MAPTAERPTEPEQVLPRPSARPFFLTIAAESMRRGDSAVLGADLAGAAGHFATAGATYRFAGSAVPAAVAFLELGAAYLALGRPDRLATTVASIHRLRQLRATEASPPGAFLFLRVCAQILEHAIEKPVGFAELLEHLRRKRRNSNQTESIAAQQAANPTLSPKETLDMTESLPFKLPADELERRLAGHPGWEIIENGARLERVIPIESLRSPSGDTARDVRSLQRLAADLTHRILRMGIPVTCLFDGRQVEIRVPANRAGLGFVEECDYAGVVGSAHEASA